MEIDQYYLDMASHVATRSKCVSLQVGCILVRNDSVLATGVNGTVKGSLNCCDKYHGENNENHHEWSLKYELHSEMNAILQSTVDLSNSTAYITHSPCSNCLKHMIAAGVSRIVFKERYWRMTNSEYFDLLQFTKSLGVILEEHN